MSAPRQTRAPGRGRVWSWLSWASLACGNTTGVVAYAADALRRPPPDIGDGWIAAPQTHHWLGLAVIAALILLVLRAAAGRGTQPQAAGETPYRDLFESSPIPMWVYDAESLRMLAVNDAAIRRYGYSHDEFLAMTIRDLDAPEDVPGVRGRGKLRDSDEHFQRHARHRARDGTVIEADIHSGPIRFAGRRARQVLAHDVTERQKSEEAAARESALLRAVIDNLPDNIYVKDRESRYLLINPAGLKVSGARREEEVLGKTAADFYPAEDAALFDAEDQKVMTSGEPLLNRERVATSGDGEKTWHLATKIPLRDRDGKIIGSVGIGRDITELRRGAEMITRLNAELEQRVRERTAQLEAANRELEAFSYSVSHDLKAPLRSIDGLSRALREDFGPKLDAAGREFLERIGAASRRMGELIDDLLALSRVTRAEIVRAPVDLSAVAEEIVSDLHKSAPARNVHVEIAPHLIAQGDPNLLRVALENLLANAWKFSSGRLQAEIEVGATRRNEQTAYYVRDNGAGFDMAYANRLFAAFQRLHGTREFPGTGVGLATVQRVIFRHGGKVWAEGAVNRGATFYFTLP